MSTLAPLKKVEFYLNDKLMFVDDTEPYEWKWYNFSFGIKTIKALPYNLNREPAGYDDSIVWKFL